MAISEAVLRLLLDDRQAKSGIKNTEKMVDGLGEKLAKSAVAWNQALELAAKGARAGQAAFAAAGRAAATSDAARVLQSTGVNVERLSESLDGMISKAKLVRNAGLAQTMGIAAKDFAELAKIAQAASIRTGQSFDHMLESIVVGTARGSKMILDNLGIIIEGPFSMEAVKKAGEDMIKTVEKAGAGATLEYAKMIAAAEDLGDAMSTMLRPAVEAIIPPLRRAAAFWTQIFGAQDGVVERNAADLTPRIEQTKRQIQALRDKLEMGILYPGGRVVEVSAAEKALIDAEIKKLEKRLTYLLGRAKATREAAIEADAAGMSAGARKSTAGKDAGKDAAKAVDPFEMTKDEVNEWNDTMSWLKEEVDKRREERKQAWRYAFADFDEEKAETERRHKETERLHKEHLRKIAREQERAARKAEMEREKEDRKKKLAEEKRLRETEAHYRKVAMIVGHEMQRVATLTMQALEDFAAGEQVKLDAIAASVLKAAGTTVIGHGIATIAGGVGQLAVTKGAVGWEAVGTGGALAAAGLAMGGAGSFWAGSIRRSASGTGGEDGGLWGQQAISTGTNTGIRAPNQSPIQIAPGAIVLGDFTAAAAGIGTAVQRGGRFLLGGT